VASFLVFSFDSNNFLLGFFITFTSFGKEVLWDLFRSWLFWCASLCGIFEMTNLNSESRCLSIQAKSDVLSVGFQVFSECFKVGFEKVEISLDLYSIPFTSLSCL
jgi:hypothetical protein